MELPICFIHGNSAPNGYFYECEEFKKNVISIWLHNTHKFDYNNGTSTKTIHSFFNTKTKTYYSPVNSKTVGSAVDINLTTPYSAIIHKASPLDSFFV